MSILKIEGRFSKGRSCNRLFYNVLVLRFNPKFFLSLQYIRVELTSGVSHLFLLTGV